MTNASALAPPLSFAEALPRTDDPYEQAVRERLNDTDERVRRDAALALGSAYIGSAPEVAKRLLLDAVDGHTETGARALLRLALLAHQHGDEPATRVYLERARELTSTSRATAPITPTLLRTRLDVAAAFAFIGQIDAAVSMFQGMDAWLRVKESPERQEAPTDSELRDIAALVCLRLGQVLADSNPSAAEPTLRRALTLGSGFVSAHAALELAKALTDSPYGLGAEIEELYRLAADFDDPIVAPKALVALGDILWFSGRPEEAEKSWMQAKERGDNALAERVTRRITGRWQHKKMRDADQIQLQRRQSRAPIDTARPSKLTELGRLASGRTFDDPGVERRVIVVGAGTGGHYIAPELTKEHGWDLVGFVDDSAHARPIGGVPVQGTIDDLARLLREDGEIDEVIFAIPTAPGSTRHRVLKACLAYNVKLVALPSMFELRRSHPMMPQLRELRVHETYGDQKWQVDREAWRMTRGRRVVVTGAGSTLGAELSRRIAQGQPGHLLLLDEPAVPLMTLHDEIRERRDLIDCDARILDCADPLELDDVFAEFGPEVVFHCGGLSHPRMGALQPLHTARANVLAAFTAAERARESGATDFVLASVDHAALRRDSFDMAKALAEGAVLGLARGAVRTTATLGSLDPHSPEDKRFRVSVLRLPNIWAESGTVVERFEQQMRDGGPLMASRNASRRFVHSWEGAHALLRVLSDTNDGGLFALTSGETVDIQELAGRTVWMNGLVPHRDIKIADYAPFDTKPATVMIGRQETRANEIFPDIVKVIQASQLRKDLDRRLSLLKQAIDAGDADGIAHALTVRGRVERAA